MRLLVAISVLLSFTRDFTVAQHYYQGLMDYLENRMLAIEDRMELWNGQAHHYHTELKDIRRLASDVMDRLAKDHLSLGQDLEGSKVRVSRVEREMDYVESQTTPRACANVADQVFEQGAWRLEEGREEEEDEDDEEEEDDEWVEVNSRVSDCVELLSNIRSVKILKRAGSPKGMWARDPKSSKVYVFNGTTGDTVYEFNSVLNFTTSTGFNHGRPVQLPSLWSGSGSAVYNSYIYYIREGTDAELQVVKYDLLKNSIRDTAFFPVDSRNPVYKLNPETVVDLAADDQGVWAMYAAGNSEPTITLAKMDPSSLDIEQMWDTKCPRENAEAAFVVCGTVYVVYNTVLASRSRVQCVFDVNDMVVSEEAPLLYFPRRYGAHASLKYNPEEKQLYAWDDGYQIIYRLTMKKKLLI